MTFIKQYGLRSNKSISTKIGKILIKTGNMLIKKKKRVKQIKKKKSKKKIKDIEKPLLCDNVKNLVQLPKKDLQHRCTVSGLKKTGTKKILAERLIDQSDIVNIKLALFNFLNRMNAMQLRQLCIIFKISKSGSRTKLIDGIQSLGISKVDIIAKIDTRKKYYICCFGNMNVKRGCKDFHIFYTNDKYSDKSAKLIGKDHKNIINGAKKCIICNEGAYLSEYENKFCVT